ncbi:MAG: polyprenyl synthetase family protein [Henriciella sp.]
MDTDALIEWALERAVTASESRGAPPKLGAAIRHAVFPGGARVRPQLALAVAYACSDADNLQCAAGAGAAIELLHCASLVHDDLPCFDDADRRRGKPSVHRSYGEALAVLTGDALIIAAFETLRREATDRPHVLPQLLDILTEAVGTPNGIIAGQAWESEAELDLVAYHRAKTGALFVAAAAAGAASVGADPAPWRALGERLGEAYQVADDLRDAVMEADALGKPSRQDAAHNRPSAVAALGLDGAVARLNGLIEQAANSVPECRGSGMLRKLVYAQAARLMPPTLVPSAAE